MPIFNLDNDWDVVRADEYYAKLKAERGWISLGKKHGKRNMAQNNYYHYILDYFAARYGCTASFAEQKYMKDLCNPGIFQKTIVNDQGDEVVVDRSSKELSVGEMSLAIKRFRNWAAAEGRIYIPYKNDIENSDDIANSMDQVIERAKDFI